MNCDCLYADTCPYADDYCIEKGCREYIANLDLYFGACGDTAINTTPQD